MLNIIIILLIGFLLYRICKKFKRIYQFKIEKKSSLKNNIIIGEEGIQNLCKEYLCSFLEDDQLLISYDEKFNRYKKINKLISSYPDSNKYFLYKMIYGLQLDEKCYFINTEQLSRDTWLNYIKELKRLHPKLKLLDYSYQNVKILNENGIKSTYLPYQKYKPEIFNFEKIYDVAIVGLNLKKKKKNQNTHRNKIFHLLKEKGVKINNICGFNLEDRDITLFQHKILLNIHFNENYKIYEEVRCTRCTLNNMIVITEESNNLSEYMYYDKIIEVKYEEIVDKTIEVLENYEDYYKKLFD
jgi:hypothetical protein